MSPRIRKVITVLITIAIVVLGALKVMFSADPDDQPPVQSEQAPAEAAPAVVPAVAPAPVDAQVPAVVEDPAPSVDPSHVD